MLAAFLVGIGLLVFGTIAERSKAAEISERNIRQANDYKVTMIKSKVYWTKRLNSCCHPGNISQTALEIAYRPYFFKEFGYCTEAMNILMAGAGVTSEQFLTWIVNYHPNPWTRSLGSSLCVLHGKYYLRMYTPFVLQGDGKYLFRQKQLLIPFIPSEEELKNQEYSLTHPIENEPYWQNTYHVVSCGEDVETFMARYPGDILFQKYFGRPDWWNFC